MTPVPKPRPRALEKQDQAADLAAIDRHQRKVCRERSGGICEVVELPWDYEGPQRCRRRATENHHLLSGIGVRNKGRSILAAHRLDVCQSCHEEITRHVLRPVGAGREYAAEVVFERQR